MVYRVIRADQLLNFEHSQVEGDITQLSDAELSALAPTGMQLYKFKQELEQRDYYLLCDVPRQPLMPTQPPRAAQIMRHSWPESRPDIAADYTPEPVNNEKPPPKPLHYLYHLDSNAPLDILEQEITGNCRFKATPLEKACYLDSAIVIKPHHYRYRIRCGEHESKHLIVGYQQKSHVKVYLAPHQQADDALLLVQPAVQYAGRLGLPCRGYFYLFRGAELVQEFKINADSTRFYSTYSSATGLSDYSGGRPSRVILLWQKISGQWVNDQYLLYREQKLTKEQFKQISVAWLAQHAVNIDVKQALASIDATIVAREAPEKPHQTAQPSVPTEHEVTLNPQSGTRQLWPEIAARYSLTPLGLLALNPQFNARPDTLKVGDKLCVTAAQPQRNTAPCYAAPPIAPQIYNHPANVFYDYSADYLKGSQQLRPIKSLQQTVANSIPVVRVANWDEEKACWLELQAAPHAKYIIEPAEQATSTLVTGTLDAQGFSYITLPDSYENKAVNIKLIPHSHYGWNDFLHDAYAFFRIGAGAIMLVGAAGASATGVGTVVGVGLASMGADQIITGFKSVYTRQEETSLGAQALQLLGVPEEYAELAYDALPLGAGMLKIAIPSLKGIQVFTQSGSQQIVSELHLLGASIRQKLTVQWGALSGTKGTTTQRTIDYIGDGRAVSGRTGYLGSPRLTRSELLQCRSELQDIGIKFERNADRYIDSIRLGARGGFDYNSGTVYLRRGTTRYEAFHEFTHAKQFSSIGREAYIKLGTYSRESHVFNELFKNRHSFTRAEMDHAVNYMKQLRYKYRGGLID